MKILKEESPKRSEEDQGLIPGAKMKTRPGRDYRGFSLAFREIAPEIWHYLFHRSRSGGLRIRDAFSKGFSLRRSI
jgi:hypothetical protein